MARDATARLYDVQEDSLELKKSLLTKKYDQGDVHFRARKGKLVNLDKLFESLWATRLSGRTSSGVISLQVTAVGKAVLVDGTVMLEVAGSKARFLLAEHDKKSHKKAYKELVDAIRSGGRSVSVTGHVAGWKGRWPAVLAKKQPKIRRILVMSYKTTK